MPVERLFPFAIRSRILVPGGDAVARLARKLEFVLLATDLSAKSAEDLKRRLGSLPQFTIYTSEELTRHFGINGAKVIGFKKSDLARSIRKELASGGEEKA